VAGNGEQCGLISGFAVFWRTQQYQKLNAMGADRDGPKQKRFAASLAATRATMLPKRGSRAIVC